VSNIFTQFNTNGLAVCSMKLCDILKHII